MASQHLEMNEEVYEELKEIYEENKDSPDKVIEYQGKEILISYLKYILIHWENLTEKDKENML